MGVGGQLRGRRHPLGDAGRAGRGLCKSLHEGEPQTGSRLQVGGAWGLPGRFPEKEEEHQPAIHIFRPGGSSRAVESGAGAAWFPTHAARISPSSGQAGPPEPPSRRLERPGSPTHAARSLLHTFRPGRSSRAVESEARAARFFPPSTQHAGRTCCVTLRRAGGGAAAGGGRSRKRKSGQERGVGPSRGRSLGVDGECRARGAREAPGPGGRVGSQPPAAAFPPRPPPAVASA